MPSGHSSSLQRLTSAVSRLRTSTPMADWSRTRQAMDRLLDRFDLHPDTGDLFRAMQPREELVAEAVGLQAKRRCFCGRSR